MVDAIDLTYLLDDKCHPISDQLELDENNDFSISFYSGKLESDKIFLNLVDSPWMNLVQGIDSPFEIGFPNTQSNLFPKQYITRKITKSLQLNEKQEVVHLSSGITKQTNLKHSHTNCPGRSVFGWQCLHCNKYFSPGIKMTSTCSCSPFSWKCGCLISSKLSKYLIGQKVLVYNDKTKKWINFTVHNTSGSLKQIQGPGRKKKVISNSDLINGNDKWKFWEKKNSF